MQNDDDGRSDDAQNENNRQDVFPFPLYLSISTK